MIVYVVFFSSNAKEHIPAHRLFLVFFSFSFSCRSSMHASVECCAVLSTRYDTLNRVESTYCISFEYVNIEPSVQIYIAASVAAVVAAAKHSFSLAI